MPVVHVSEKSSLFSLTRILPTLEIFRLHSRDRLNVKLPPCQNRDSHYRKYRLIFIMGIVIPRKTVFIWRPGPSSIYLMLKRGSFYTQFATSWLILFKTFLVTISMGSERHFLLISIGTSNGSWRQGIKGEMTCTVYVALVWNIIYWIMMIITLFTE